MKLIKDYELVVGLEVHVELKTKTKIFCSCPTDFGAPPNTQCCPVCMGLPAAMPRLNARAAEYAVTAGLALGCRINKVSRFDRKNYFYPDLPKGYQITQYFTPLCEKGGLRIDTQSGEKTIGITRIHMEEDAGKLSHEVLRDGVERADEHSALIPVGESAEYVFDAPTEIHGIRLVFDSNFNRGFWQMPKNFVLHEENYKPCEVMTRDYDITLTLEDGSVETLKLRNNRTRLVKLPLERTVKSVRFTVLSTFGAEAARVFTFELY